MPANARLSHAGQYGSNSAYLYHTTKLRYAQPILERDALYATSQSNGSRAVSLTRDGRHVRHYLDQQNYVRLTLDRNKLSAKLSIRPYSEGEVGKDGQAEEHISTDIHPLSEYLVAIKIVQNTPIQDNELDSWNYLAKHNSPREAVMEESNGDKVIVDRDGAGLKESCVLIENGSMAAFLKKLDALSKKAVKFGLEPITILSQREVLYQYEFEAVGRDGDRIARSLVPVYGTGFVEHPVVLNRIELKFPEVRLGNWRVVGKIESFEGSNLVFTVTEHEDDRSTVRAYADHPITCEHCNKKRVRNDGFVLRDVEAGGFKQVGSGCLEDFTGIDPGAALFLTKMYSVIKVIEGDLDGYAGGGHSNAIAPESYLAYVSYLADHGGFVSAAKARDGGYTATYADARMLPTTMQHDEKVARQFAEEADKHYERASKVRAWIAEKTAEGDFDRNLKILLAPDVRYLKAEPKHLAFVAAAVPMYLRTHELAERQKRSPSAHVGVPGAKLNSPLTVRRVIEIANNYGPGPMYLVLMTDGAGNSLKWKSGAVPDDIRKGEGRTFEAAFKVKEHGTYQGQSQTTVTHLKLQRWLDVEEAPDASQHGAEESAAAADVDHEHQEPVDSSPEP